MEREAERRRVGRPQIRERPGEEQHDRADTRGREDAERADGPAHVTGEGRDDDEDEPREQEQRGRGGIPRGGERDQDREAEEPPAPRRAPAVVETADPDDRREHEGQGDVDHQGPEAALRDRVARDGIHPVRQRRRERGTLEPDDPAHQSVRAERAKRDRHHHEDGAGHRDRTEEHRAQRAHERERRRGRRRRTHARIAPRGTEGIEEIADPRPADQGPDRRHVARDEMPGPEQHEREEHHERDRCGCTHSFGNRVDGRAGAVPDRAQPRVGVQVVTEPRADPSRRADVELAQVAVVDPPSTLRPCP